jgi:hypothetical protein
MALIPSLLKITRPVGQVVEEVGIKFKDIQTG